MQVPRTKSGTGHPSETAVQNTGPVQSLNFLSFGRLYGGCP